MKLRRLLAAAGGLGMAMVLTVGCQPNPPSTPPPVTIKLQIVMGGPIVIGENEAGDPIDLTDTPPVLQVLSTYDEACDPISQSVSDDVVMAPSTWVDPDTSVTKQTWNIYRATVTAVIPGDAECTPESDGTSYILAGYADTAHNDGPADGKAVGYALDDRLGDLGGNAQFHLVK